jgi:hypothetical protein
MSTPGSGFSQGEGRRQPINPFLWIDRTIINHRPEPEPPPAVSAVPPTSLVRKDPKLTRLLMAMEAEKQAGQRDNYGARVNAAIDC